MAHDVFISYSTGDKPTADAVCATLEAKHIRCWIAPRDVLPGRDYAEMLIEAIRDARVMVLVFSANSNSSLHVMREVERAASKGIPILPLRIEDVPPCASMEYYISSTHWLDALTPPLERHLEQLTETVQLLIARAERAAPVGQEPEAPVSAPTAEAAVDAEMGREPPSPGVLEVAKRWSRRPRALLALGAGAIAVVAIIIVVVLLSGGGENGTADVVIQTTTMTTADIATPTVAATASSTTTLAVTTTTALAIQVNEYWKFKTGAEVWSSPAISGGVVYFGSNDGYLYALDSQSGQEKWKVKTGGWVRSSPAISEGVVFFGSYDGYLYALDSQSGQEKWSYHTLDGGSWSSPAIADGMVYFGSDDGYLYALDAESGQENWRAKTGSGVHSSSPAIADGVVYFGSGDFYLYAVH